MVSEVNRPDWPFLTVEEQLSLARQIAGRLTRRYGWVDRDDIYSYSLLGLILATRRYNPSQGSSFSHFAAQKGLFLAIDEMRKDRVLCRRDRTDGVRFSSLEVGGDDDVAGTVDLVDPWSLRESVRAEARDIVLSLLSHLTDIDRQLLTMYYSDEMTYSEISKVLKLSESSICLRHRKLLDKLRKFAEIIPLA